MKNLSNENIIHIKKGNVEFIQFRRLLEYSDTINHAYCIGLDRNFRTETLKHTPLSNEQREKAINDYKELTEAINSNYMHIVKSRQKHTKTVKFIENKDTEPEFFSEKYENTDGLITNKPNIMLSTTNADCILLLFFDPVKKVIANTHSGWRGTLQRISVETVKKMKEKYNSNPKDIICCMCPSIRKCHFEVEKDVKEEFENEFKELSGFITETEQSKKWNIDTIFINKEILKQAGLQGKNIIDSGICSVCESNQIHSYRAEGENYGLATAIIEIKG
ncbi:MAG: peptidoglycan editing factor PgeF [Clostridia bacterium]|nr:peptidoglycan editing factor PgeF [Clostridia bacterium]